MIGRYRELIARAEQAGVTSIVLTGTSLKSSQESLQIARRWAAETNRKTLYCTVGVHPHDAKSFSSNTVQAMRSLLSDDLAVAVGECGLDYNRMFSTRDQQMVS
jgi:TatD DNase family protein